MDPFDIELVEQGKKCGVHIQALNDVEVWKDSPNYINTSDIIIEEIYNSTFVCLNNILLNWGCAHKFTIKDIVRIHYFVTAF